MVYDETATMFDTLPTEKAGELIQAMSRYKLKGDLPEGIDPIVAAIFAGEKLKMDEAEAKYQRRCEANAANGKKGGRPRKSKTEEKQSVFEESEGLFEKPKKSEKSQQNKTKLNQTKPNKTVEDISSFSLFWEAYPKKVGKVDARKAWSKLAPDEAMTADIMKGLSKWKRSEQWTRDDGKFIPHPATWLRGERWNDEVQVATPSDRHPPSYDSDAYMAKARGPLEYHRREET